MPCLREGIHLSNNIDTSYNGMLRDIKMKRAEYIQKCNHQATLKKNFAQHKSEVHEGVKYSRNQCNYQSTKKGNVAKHNTAVHEKFKYPCGHCTHQATTKGHLTQHKRSVHDSNTLVTTAVIKQPERTI